MDSQLVPYVACLSYVDMFEINNNHRHHYKYSEKVQKND